MTGRAIGRGILAVLFVAAGVNHFLDPETYLRIVPPSLPYPLALVYLSGVLEIAGGAGLLSSHWRAAAGWGLILLLVAVFPANLYMARHPALFPEVDSLLLWWRLPLQAVLIAWTWWVTRPAGAQGQSASSDS